MKPFLCISAVVTLCGCAQPHGTEFTSAQAPIIRSIIANPNSVAVGRHSIIVCDAYDPVGSPLTHRWRTGVGDIIGQGSEVRSSAACCCVGTNRITVTVANGRGGNTTGFVDVEVR